MHRIKGRPNRPGKIVGFTVLLIALMSFPVVSQENHDSGHADGINRIDTNAADGKLVPSVVGLFKKHVSPIDGARCPMYPSCSQYSLDTIHKHGLIMGWIMTCDRLLRCGRDELSTAPMILINGEPRCYDSVEDNDFWWAR